jgi:hypothetical protein
MHRFFFVLGEKAALVEAPDLSFRLLHLTMMQHSITHDYGGAADYIRDHVTYPDLPAFDVSRPADENAEAAQAIAATVDSFFILDALARLSDHMRQLREVTLTVWLQIPLMCTVLPSFSETSLTVSLAWTSPLFQTLFVVLQELGGGPRDYVLSQRRRPALWSLSRTTNTLLGREREVSLMLRSLQMHGSAVIRGGPGEGKTSIAMEAAAQLHVAEPNLSAFELDMRGECAATMCGGLPWSHRPFHVHVAASFSVL